MRVLSDTALIPRPIPSPGADVHYGIPVDINVLAESVFRDIRRLTIALIDTHVLVNFKGKDHGYESEGQQR